jgi:hypothetical protein
MSSANQMRRCVKKRYEVGVQNIAPRATDLRQTLFGGENCSGTEANLCVVWAGLDDQTQHSYLLCVVCAESVGAVCGCAGRAGIGLCCSDHCSTPHVRCSSLNGQRTRITDRPNGTCIRRPCQGPGIAMVSDTPKRPVRSSQATHRGTDVAESLLTLEPSKTSEPLVMDSPGSQGQPYFAFFQLNASSDQPIYGCRPPISLRRVCLPLFLKL